MGHNVSNRKRSGMVLRSPLADFASWSLALDCGNERCARDRVYDVGGLSRAYPGRTVSEALHRMRCSGCGCAPVLARLVPRSHVDRTRVGAVALRGPGSS